MLSQCLGNHEFDFGVDELLGYLRTVRFPVVATNLDLTLEPQLADVRSLRRSVVLTVLDRRIGIIGYLTPATKRLAPPNNVGITDVVTAIK